MTSKDPFAAFSGLLAEGVAFSWCEDRIGCSFPDGLVLSDALDRAGIEDESLALALTRRIAQDESTRSVVASGPPTPGQERLLRSRALLSDHRLLIKPTTIMIKGPLDPFRLGHAVDHAVRRFSALRAQMRLRGDGVFVQCIAAPQDGLLQQIDLSRAARPESALDAELQRLTNHPFGPLDPYIRAALFRLNAQYHCLAVSIHHMVSDVWSVGLFYQALSRAYANPQERAPAAAESADLYFDAVRAVHARRCSELGQAGLAYWVDLLDHKTTPVEWTDAPGQRPAIGLRFKDHVFAIDSGVAGSLDRYARASGISRGQCMLAAWAITLRVFARTDTISIGVMAACRASPEVEAEMGFFSNPVVFRADFAERLSLQDLVAASSRQMTRALEHQETPVQDIIGRLYQRPDFDVERLYQAMFAYNNVPVTELALEGVTCREVDPTVADLRTEISTIDVRLSLTPLHDGLRAVLTYKADVFGETRIAEMARVYTRCLSAIASGRDAYWQEIEP